MRGVKRTMKVLAAAVLALLVSPTKAQPRVAFTRTFDDVRVRFLSTQITAIRAKFRACEEPNGASVRSSRAMMRGFCSTPEICQGLSPPTRKS